LATGVVAKLLGNVLLLGVAGLDKEPSWLFKGLAAVKEANIAR
jgi:hypothetical protein